MISVPITASYRISNKEVFLLHTEQADILAESIAEMLMRGFGAVPVIVRYDDTTRPAEMLVTDEALLKTKETKRQQKAADGFERSRSLPF